MAPTALRGEATGGTHFVLVQLGDAIYQDEKHVRRKKWKDELHIWLQSGGTGKHTCELI